MNYRVNLLPPDLMPAPDVDSKRLSKLVGATLVIGLVALIAGTAMVRFILARSETAVLQNELKGLQLTVKKVEEIRAARKDLEEKTSALELLRIQRKLQYPLLHEIADTLPVDMWLVEARVEEVEENPGQKDNEKDNEKTQTENEKTPPPFPNTLILKGFSRSLPSIGVYIKNLSVFPYFSEVKLNGVKEEADGTLSFEIICKFIPDGGK